jgi:hypothetical protein
MQVRRQRPDTSFDQKTSSFSMDQDMSDAHASPTKIGFPDVIDRFCFS